jgi:hypothetical protein
MVKKACPKSKKAKRKIHKVMKEFDRGVLNSGSKSGPKVTSRKQAIAIALDTAKRDNKRQKRLKKASGASTKKK